MPYCSSCKAEFSFDYEYCPQCGKYIGDARLEPIKMTNLDGITSETTSKKEVFYKEAANNESKNVMEMIIFGTPERIVEEALIRHSINYEIVKEPTGLLVPYAFLGTENLLISTYHPFWIPTSPRSVEESVGEPRKGPSSSRGGCSSHHCHCSSRNCSPGDCSAGDCDVPSNAGALVLLILIPLLIIFLIIFLTPFAFSLLTLLWSVLASGCLFIFNIVTFGVFRDYFKRVAIHVDTLPKENLRLSLMEISEKGGVPNIRGVSVIGFFLCRIGAIFTMLGVISAIFVYGLRHFFQWMTQTYYLVPIGMLLIGFFLFVVGALKIRGARLATQRILTALPY
ncbi:MAG: hypothetical protein ACFFBD_00275 [Candidatus Hodarchaeota archaeon]